MRLRFIVVIMLMLFCPAPAVLAGAVDDLLARYQAQGAHAFSPEAGAAFWKRPVPDSTSGQKRSCLTCHGRDLRGAGKHVTTGKPIDPMAPSVNPKRLTDPAFIEKWFTRNCQWTLGRSCTPQEKGDVLRYLDSQ